LEEFIRERGNFQKRLEEFNRIEKAGRSLPRSISIVLLRGLMDWEGWVWNQMKAEEKRKMIKSASRENYMGWQKAAGCITFWGSR
jgi:hypothetical protein